MTTRRRTTTTTRQSCGWHCKCVSVKHSVAREGLEKEYEEAARRRGIATLAFNSTSKPHAHTQHTHTTHEHTGARDGVAGGSFLLLLPPDGVANRTKPGLRLPPFLPPTATTYIAWRPTTTTPHQHYQPHHHAVSPSLTLYRHHPPPRTTTAAGTQAMQLPLFQLPLFQLLLLLLPPPALPPPWTSSPPPYPLLLPFLPFLPLLLQTQQPCHLLLLHVHHHHHNQSPPPSSTSTPTGKLTSAATSGETNTP